MTSGIPTSSRLAVAILLSALGQSALSANETASAPPVENGNREVPFVLAIRGGVSLGAYESGVNWALMQFMRRHRAAGQAGKGTYIQLKAAAGASAGSINAVLSGIAWCKDGTRARDEGSYVDTIDDNVLRDTWLGIGFEELLPKQTRSLLHYREDDGVFTRNAFKETIADMEGTLKSGGFRPGCEVPVAIMVTRVKPVEKLIAGVAVHNQRFVLPMTLKADETGHASLLSCLTDVSDPGSGNIIYMQGTPTADPACPLSHSTTDLVDAIEASSAFPIAFGRKRLHYCMPEEDARNEVPESHGSCPGGYVPLAGDFIDGGLFDNLPLGAAKALAEPRRSSPRSRAAWDTTGRRFNYIYLDPTIRRSLKHQPGQLSELSAEQEYLRGAAEQKRTFGLRSQFFSFFGGAVHSGRDYELYSLLRHGDWTSQVSALAQELAAAVSEGQAIGVTYATDPVPGPYAGMDCRNLFAGSKETHAPADPDRVMQAMFCIEGRVQELERQHNGIALGGGDLMSSSEITALRNECLSWISSLAAWIDAPDVEWSAERARYDKLGDRRILMSSRFSPVVGEMMEAFGGFVDRDFRDYDYYAGVYDAAWSMSNFLCGEHARKADCMASNLHHAYQSLDIPSHERARTVFLYLARREFAAEPGWNERFAWVDVETPDQPDRNMLAIANSLFEGHDRPDSLFIAAPGMTAFITRLIEEQYDESQSSAFLKRIFKLKDSEELTWYYPLSLRASNRLLYLEKREAEAKGDGEVYVAGLALGAFALHSYMQEEEVTLNVSTAPDFSWQSWLPDEVAVNARSGGLDLSWYQGLRIGHKGWRWDVKFTPIQLNHSNASRDDNVWFSQADFLLSYKKHGMFSAVGAGPTASWTWKNWPGSKQLNFGAAIYVGLVEDKIRLTFGTMNFGNDFEGDTYYFNIGVNDFPGLIYWGFPDWRGSWLPEKVQW